ncbi:MAG: aminotransferase class III-fold pyridoxal phosphate-dependent enzyme, partial [Pseudomonadota bacterium]
PFEWIEDRVELRHSRGVPVIGRIGAKTVGAYVLSRFQDLQKTFPVIGDVRGCGLFFGIELVKNQETKEPAPEAAHAVVNWLRHHGVLMSKIGEHGNVLKLRPPLCFSKENADQLISALEEALTVL